MHLAIAFLKEYLKNIPVVLNYQNPSFMCQVMYDHFKEQIADSF